MNFSTERKKRLWQPFLAAEGSMSIKNLSCLGRQKRFFRGGPEEIRTPDPHNANVVRYQLRYEPLWVTVFSRILLKKHRLKVGAIPWWS